MKSRLLIIALAAAAALCLEAVRLHGEQPSFASDLIPPSAGKQLQSTIDTAAPRAGKQLKEGQESSLPEAQSDFQSPTIAKESVIVIVAPNPRDRARTALAINSSQEPEALKQFHEKYDTWLLELCSVPAVITADGFVHYADCEDLMPGKTPVANLLKKLEQWEAKKHKAAAVGEQPQPAKRAASGAHNPSFAPTVATTTAPTSAAAAAAAESGRVPSAEEANRASRPAIVSLGQPAPLEPVPDPAFAK